MEQGAVLPQSLEAHAIESSFQVPAEIFDIRFVMGELVGL
jgi:hypothetical protein